MQKSVFCKKIDITCWIWTVIKMTVFNVIQRAINPPHHQILRIDREVMIDDIIMHETWCHLCTKTQEKDVVGIVTFDLIGLLPTNHIIAHITIAYRSFWGNVQCEKFINSQTTKNIWNFIVIKSNLQEIPNFGNCPGDFRLQTGDWEKRFKIRSLPDYSGELTALHFCLPVFTEIIVAKPEVNILFLEVTFYWAAHESNTQSRNTFGYVEKDKMADKTPRRLCVSHSPLQWWPIFAWRGQIISGHLRSSGEQTRKLIWNKHKIIAWSYWPYVY